MPDFSDIDPCKRPVRIEVSGADGRIVMFTDLSLAVPFVPLPLQFSNVPVYYNDEDPVRAASRERLLAVARDFTVRVGLDFDDLINAKGLRAYGYYGDGWKYSDPRWVLGSFGKGGPGNAGDGKAGTVFTNQLSFQIHDGRLGLFADFENGLAVVSDQILTNLAKLPNRIDRTPLNSWREIICTALASRNRVWRSKSRPTCISKKHWRTRSCRSGRSSGLPDGRMHMFPLRFPASPERSLAMATMYR